ASSTVARAGSRRSAIPSTLASPTARKTCASSSQAVPVFIRCSCPRRSAIVQEPEKSCVNNKRDHSVTNQGTNAAGGRMHIRRFVTALAACTAIAMSLPADDAGATDQAIVDAAKTEGKLVIYTGVERAAAQALVNAFEKKYPFISAEAVRASSSKIATRLDAEIEADRVQGDVFEFSLLYLTTSLRKRGEILKYDSSDYAHYPAAYADPGYWAATGVSSIIILLNTRKVDEPNVPQSWWDLTKPYWKNKLTIDNLEVSGTGYNWLIAIVNDSRLGWKFIEELGRNKPVLER